MVADLDTPLVGIRGAITILEAVVERERDVERIQERRERQKDVENHVEREKQRGVVEEEDKFIN